MVIKGCTLLCVLYIKISPNVLYLSKYRNYLQEKLMLGWSCIYSYSTSIGAAAAVAAKVYVAGCGCKWMEDEKYTVSDAGSDLYLFCIVNQLLRLSNHSFQIYKKEQNKIILVCWLQRLTKFASRLFKK